MVGVGADKHNVSQQWWAAHSSSRANAGCATGGWWRGPPSQLPQPLLQLTAYPHSTAPGSCCSMEAGVEEDGTTCSVVQPHLLRPVDEHSVCGPLGNTGGCGSLMSASTRSG